MDAKVKKYYEMNHKIILEPCEDGGYFVSIPDLPGCMSQGDNLDEAAEMILDAKAAWIEVALKRGLSIPLLGSSNRRGYHYRIETHSLTGDGPPTESPGYAKAA